MDILRVLSSPDLEVRKKTLQLVLDLVTSRNIHEVWKIHFQKQSKCVLQYKPDPRNLNIANEPHAYEPVLSIHHLFGLHVLSSVKLTFRL